MKTDYPTEDAVRRHKEKGFFGPIQRPEALHRLFMKGFLWVRNPAGEEKWLRTRDEIRVCAYKIGDKWYFNGKSEWGAIDEYVLACGGQVEEGQNES